MKFLHECARTPTAPHTKWIKKKNCGALRKMNGDAGARKEEGRGGLRQAPPPLSVGAACSACFRFSSKLKAQALADLDADHLEDALAGDGLDEEDAEEAELKRREKRGTEKRVRGRAWRERGKKKASPAALSSLSVSLTMAARELVTSAFSTKPNLALGAMGWTGGSVTPWKESKGESRGGGWS